MAEWWNGLDNVLRVLYCIAAPATLLLVIQTVLSVAGGLGDGGEGVNFSDTSGLDMPDSDLDTDWGELADADVGDLAAPEQDGGPMPHHTDGSGPGDAAVFRLLTLQTVVAFLTVFSWSAIVSISTGAPALRSIVIGLALGVAAMFLVAKLVQASRRLVENGTVNLKNAIGESGKVYLPIPPESRGEGKIMLQVQGQLAEFSAVTYGKRQLPTGMIVRVTDVLGDALVVEAEE